MQGLGLQVLNRFASSDWPDRLKVRKPIERILYNGSKASFQLVGTLARQFGQGAPKLDGAQRLAATPKGVFDLSLTDEQKMLRDTLQRFAREAIRPAAHAADEAARFPEDVRAQALELGLTFYSVPEALGGMATDQSVVTNVIAAEDLGYGDFTLGAGILAPMSVANALTRWGTKEQQGKYLPAFAGETPPIATFAVSEARPAFNPNDLLTIAKRSGDAFVLNGEKSLVLLGEEAELFLVAAMLDGKPAVFIVEGGAGGLAFEEEPAMGLKAAHTVKARFTNVRAEKLGDETFDYTAFLDLGALGLCALAIGTAHAVLDYTIEYANDRKAFGEPISHRQSVAFLIADIAIELDSMRLLVWRAAALADQGESFHRAAYLARLLCIEKAMKIGTDGVQLVGGHGYTKEHPVERWYRDLRAIGVLHSGLHA
ncbi:MAG: acyl-CoA dehydrogenase family protein [Polyangiaceae bacterium]|nr:acyl-CoA dehydrogenase family protein [Polyangiaceae bacterium]